MQLKPLRHKRVKLKRLQRRSAPKPSLDIFDVITEKKLFGNWFTPRRTWVAWFAFLKAIFALPMSAKEGAIFREATGRSKAPRTQVTEAWMIVGRRGGKSRVMALLAVFMACFIDWKPYLAPGERATILLIATDRKQARILFRYIEAFLKLVPLLKPLVDRDTMELFELKTKSVNIEIHTASFRAVRGYTIVTAILDEIAFFRSEESHNPDYEIIEALRPGMATIPGALLLCASSPYSRRGELYQHYKDYYGKETEDILVWKAPTWVMNPSVPASFLERQYERNPASAKAEYGAEFRKDIDSPFSDETVEACTMPGVFEERYRGDRTYKAFTDPSGGSSDSFTLAIGHTSKESKATLDLLREAKPPFSPEGIVEDFCKVLKGYGITRVKGDRYAGEWPREQFLKYGILYEVEAKTKSELYRELLPLVNSRQCQLLDDKKLHNQMIGLERRTHRGGKDVYDHPTHSHDDIVNAAAGVLIDCQTGTMADVW